MFAGKSWSRLQPDVLQALSLLEDTIGSSKKTECSLIHSMNNYNNNFGNAHALFATRPAVFVTPKGAPKGKQPGGKISPDSVVMEVRCDDEDCGMVSAMRFWKDESFRVVFNACWHPKRHPTRERISEALANSSNVES